MIRKYFKMKWKMIEMKLVCFSYISKFLKDKEEIVDTVLRLVQCLADVPGEELQEKFLAELAELTFQQVGNKEA
ncbi:MAG: hypothetical protein ACRDBO_02620 [Lachnospiraceae bacterium]